MTDPHEKEVEELLNDIEMGSDLGPEVSQNVAASFIKTVTRPLSKESKSKLRENIKTRSNCKEFVPPKINNEIMKLFHRMLDWPMSNSSKFSRLSQPGYQLWQLSLTKFYLESQRFPKKL